MKTKLYYILAALAFVAAVVTMAAGHAVEGGLMMAAAPMLLAPQAGVGLNSNEGRLIAWLNDRHPELAAKLGGNQIRLKDDFLYVKKVISFPSGGTNTGLSGTAKILDATSSFAVGVCNVDKGKLDKDTAFIVDRIRVSYVTSGTTETDASAVAVTGYSSDVNAFPAGLYHAELEVWQGRNFIQSIPVSLCGSMADTTGPSGQGDAYHLKTPFVLAPEEQIELKLAFAAAIAPAATTRYVEVMMLGTSSRKRGNV